jgi:uncharacterized membrane protein
MENTSLVTRNLMSPQKRVASTLNLLLGIWLFIAGIVLAVKPSGRWNDFVVGVLLFVFAASRMGRKSNPAWSWANFVLGIWLLFAPNALGFTSATSRWNDVAVGIAAIVLSIISGTARDRFMSRDIAAVTETRSVPEHRKVA